MGKPNLRPKNRLHQLLLSNKDALACLFDQGIVSVAGFATSVLIGRLAPAELGVYYIGLSLVLFARGFQQQLISTPYTIYLHRQSDEGAPAFRGSCLILELGFIAITVVFLLAQILAAWGGWVSSEIVPSLVVLLAFLPAILIRELVRHYCFTHAENMGVLAIDFATSVLQIAVLFGLGYFGVLSGATAWVAIGASCILVIGYWFLTSGPAIQFQKERIGEDLKLNWSFGKWAVSGQFIGSLPNYLLPWLLLVAAGTEGTGFFAACMTLVGIANIFNTGMANFLTPKAAKVYVEEGAHGLKRVLVRMYLLFLVAVGSFVAFLAIFGGWVATQLFGPEYAGLQTILTLLAVAKLFEGFQLSASGGLFAMEKIKANFWIDVVLMLVTITAALALIQPLGVLGAAWTMCIGSGTSAILRSIVVARYLVQAAPAGGDNV